MLLPAHRYFQPLHFQEPQPRHDSPSPQITIWPFKAVGTSKVREKKEQMHHLAPTVANNAAGGRNGWNWSVYIYIYYICRHRSSIIKHCLSHRVSHTEPHMLGRPKKDSEDLVNWSRVFVSAPADDTSTTFQISTHSFLSVQVIFKSLTQVGLLHPYLRKPKIVNFKWLKNECNPPQINLWQVREASDRFRCFIVCFTCHLMVEVCKASWSPPAGSALRSCRQSREAPDALDELYA